MENLASDVDRVTTSVVRGLWVRGIVAIAFGLIILIDPQVSLSVLVLLVAAFAAVDGVTALAMAFGPLPGRARALLVISGLAGLGVAAITVLNPQITEIALVYLIGAWAILLGVSQFALAFSLPVDAGSRIVMFIYGAASVVFGAIMFIQPGTGALGLLALISAYAIVSGITLIGAGWKLRSKVNEVRNAVTTSVAGSNA